MKYLLVICALFLSSASVEAKHGEYSAVMHAPSELFNCPRCSYLGGAYRIHIQPFDKPKAAVPYTTVIWPHLPSTSEVMIRMASERLAKLVQAMEEEKATRVAPAMESLSVASAVGLWGIGLFLILYGTITGLEARKGKRD